MYAKRIFTKRRFLAHYYYYLCLLRACLTHSVGPLLIQISSALPLTSPSNRWKQSAPNIHPTTTTTRFFSNTPNNNYCSDSYDGYNQIIMEAPIQKLQDIIGTDAGGRGMKSLIVPGDLYKASEVFGKLPAKSTVLVLSGFPCAVNETPPTETDGPPGAYAIARAAVALGHECIVVTDDCNQAVFAAGLQNLALPTAGSDVGSVSLQTFPSTLSSAGDQKRFDQLADKANLIIACERAGPGVDGICYTMRGINMNEKGLIAPLHELVEKAKVPFLAIGDGGNELGMGKVLEAIKTNPKIADGAKIGCAVAADYLIAASVSNWGGYALAAGAALIKAKEDGGGSKVAEWVNKCVPTHVEEIELLERCVAAGCRDGVSMKMEATVDGMPLETSLECLSDIRSAALEATQL